MPINRWYMKAGRFTTTRKGETLSVSITAAWDYIVKEDYIKTMLDLQIDYLSYSRFKMLVCRKLSIPKIYWPKGFKL